MIPELEIGGSGEPDALIVLLHGLDHSDQPLRPVLRALRELVGYMEACGEAPLKLRVLTPYRGAADRPKQADADVTLKSMVETFYAPTVESHRRAPIVTIAESLGAALSDVWSWREPRIVHQVWLDPLPTRLDLVLLDRFLVAGAMVLQLGSFWLRKLGVNLSRLGDAALLRQSLDDFSRTDRREYMQRKMEASHWKRSLLEARLIFRLALMGAAAEHPPADKLSPVTAFLPPRGPGWLDRKLIHPATHRIASASFVGRRGARIARTKAGSHYNIAELAAPYVAWRALTGLCVGTPQLEKAARFFDQWPLAAQFADRYWTELAGGTAPAPAAPDLDRNTAEHRPPSL